MHINGRLGTLPPENVRISVLSDPSLSNIAFVGVIDVYSTIKCPKI